MMEYKVFNKLDSNMLSIEQNCFSLCYNNENSEFWKSPHDFYGPNMKFSSPELKISCKFNYFDFVTDR